MSATRSGNATEAWSALPAITTSPAVACLVASRRMRACRSAWNTGLRWRTTEPSALTTLHSGERASPWTTPLQFLVSSTTATPDGVRATRSIWASPPDFTTATKSPTTLA